MCIFRKRLRYHYKRWTWTSKKKVRQNRCAIDQLLFRDKKAQRKYSEDSSEVSCYRKSLGCPSPSKPISINDEDSETVMSVSPSFGNNDVRSQEMDLPESNFFNQNDQDEVRSDQLPIDTIYSKKRSSKRPVLSANLYKHVFLSISK